MHRVPATWLLGCSRKVERAIKEKKPARYDEIHGVVERLAM